jgi:hypothetical protein
MNFFKWLFAEPPQPPTAPVVVPRDFETEHNLRKVAVQAETDKWLEENKEQFIIVVTTKSNKVYKSVLFKASAFVESHYTPFDHFRQKSYIMAHKCRAEDNVRKYVNAQTNSPYFHIDNSYIAHDRIESIEIEPVLEKVE